MGQHIRPSLVTKFRLTSHLRRHGVLFVLFAEFRQTIYNEKRQPRQGCVGVCGLLLLLFGVVAVVVVAAVVWGLVFWGGGLGKNYHINCTFQCQAGATLLYHKLYVCEGSRQPHWNLHRARFRAIFDWFDSMRRVENPIDDDDDDDVSDDGDRARNIHAARNVSNENSVSAKCVDRDCLPRK